MRYVALPRTTLVSRCRLASMETRSIEDGVRLEFDEYVGLEEEGDADDRNGGKWLRESRFVGDELDSGHGPQGGLTTVGSPYGRFPQ